MNDFLAVSEEVACPKSACSINAPFSPEAAAIQKTTAP